MPAAAALLIILLLWLVLSETGVVPAYMLPSPVDVLKAFAGDFTIILRHSAYTLTEAAAGLMMGVLLAFVMAT